MNHNLVLCQYINGDFMSKSKKDGLLPDDKPIIKNVHPTCTELREWIKYNPNTGEMTRRKSKFTKFVDAPVNVTVHYDVGGHLHKTIFVNKKHYCVNIALWCYMTGHRPTRKEAVIFLDGNWDNLKFSNLKLITKSEYLHMTQGSIGRHFGVYKGKGRPSSRIRTPNGKQPVLGRFNTEQEARIAYLKEKKEIRDSITRKYGITNVNRVVNKKTGGVNAQN